mgnify:CR=1 FL=1
MSWQEDNAEIAGIVTAATGSRKHRCPRCTDQRKNKADRALSITRQGTEVMWYCHHCEWHGGYDEARSGRDSVGFTKKDKPRNPEKNERWRRGHVVW